MFRPAAPADTPDLVALAITQGTPAARSRGPAGGGVGRPPRRPLGDGHQAQVWTDGPAGPPAGWAYFAPAAKADQVWDLWWIGVAPTRQGEGIGGELLRFVEAHVRAVGGRLLLIETSSLPTFDPIRRFYAKRGYVECGRVPDFYAEGDDKMIYAKRIADRASGEG